MCCVSKCIVVAMERQLHSVSERLIPAIFMLVKKHRKTKLHTINIFTENVYFENHIKNSLSYEDDNFA